jgi:transcriptional regulator with XRE-family HTH domain
MTIGQLLRCHREALGPDATQDYVARSIGVQKESISRWENDHVASIKAVYLVRLAEHYGTDPAEYLRLLAHAAHVGPKEGSHGAKTREESGSPRGKSLTS